MGSSAKIEADSVEIDWDEALLYRAGQKVELKSKPGTVDAIASYDPMMVPPIWLVNDPKPRYPHELQVVASAPEVNDLVSSRGRF
jgi:hypothetical protein